MYADDTTAFIVGKSIDETTNGLTIFAKDIQEWCKADKLTIHSEKIISLIMTPRPVTDPSTGSATTGLM